MDPIQTTVALAGERANLISPAAVQAYDPSASADYTPNTPGVTPVRGVPEGKIMFEVGGSGQFTFQATSKPEGLEKDASKLDWRGHIWRVMAIRQRTWRGKTNGFTLTLAF